MGARVTFVLVLLLATLLSVAYGKNTLYADYLAPAIEDSVRIPRAKLVSTNANVLDIGTLNIHSIEGLTVETLGSFSVEGATTALTGENVQVSTTSSDSNIAIRADHVFNIDSQHTEITGASLVIESTDQRFDINVREELRSVSTSNTNVRGFSADVTSGEGFVTFDTQGRLFTNGDTIQFEGTNGLFVTSNDIKATSGNSFDTDSNSLEWNSNSNVLIQSQFNDVQLTAAHVLAVESAKVLVEGDNGVLLLSRQGEVIVDAASFANVAVGNSLVATADKRIALSGGSLSIAATDAVNLLADQGVQFDVLTGGSTVIEGRSTTKFAANNFGINLEANVVIRSKENSVSILSQRDLKLSGDTTVEFRGLGSDVKVSAALDANFDASSHLGDAISIGKLNGNTQPGDVTFTSNDLYANGGSISIASTTAKFVSSSTRVSAMNEPYDKVDLSGATVTWTAPQWSLNGGDVTLSSSGTVSLEANAATFTTSNAGNPQQQNIILFKSSGTETFTVANSIDIKSAQFKLSSLGDATLTGSSTFSISSGRDIQSDVSGLITWTATDLTLSATDDQEVKSTNSHTIASSGLLSVRSGKTMTVNSNNQALWIADTTLTSTADSLNWRAEGVSTISGNTNVKLTSGGLTSLVGFGLLKTSDALSMTATDALSWNSGLAKDISFTSGVKAEFTASNNIRASGHTVKVSMGNDVTFTATNSDLFVSTSSEKSFIYNAGSDAKFTSTNGVMSIKAGGDVDTTTLSTLTWTAGLGFDISTSNEAWLHGNTETDLTVVSDARFLSQTLVDVVAGASLTGVSTNAYGSVNGRTITADAGTVSIFNTGANGAAPFAVGSSKNAELVADGAVSIRATAGGSSLTGTLQVAIVTNGTETIQSANDILYTSNTFLSVTGTESLNTHAGADVTITATKSTTHTGALNYIQGGGVSVGAATITVDTPENALLYVNAGGSLSLSGGAVSVLSNNDVRANLAGSLAYTVTDGVLEVGATKHDALVQMRATNDATFQTKNGALFTVDDRSNGAGHMLFESGRNTLLSLDSATANTAAANAFSVTSGGSTFDNVLGHTVGILLRTTADSKADVHLTAAGGDINVLGQTGSTTDVRRGAAQLTATSALLWQTSGGLLDIESGGEFRVNVVGSGVNGDTSLLTTGTAAPITVESSGRLVTAAKTTMSLQGNGASNVNRDAVDILSDGGHMVFSLAGSLVNTAARTLISTGNDASFSPVQGSVSVTAQNGAVVIEGQSGASFTNSGVQPTDSVTIDGTAFVRIESSLNNDARLGSTAGAASFTSTAATVVKSADNTRYEATVGKVTFDNTKGTTSLYSAGSANVFATGTGEVRFESNKDQVWTARSEMIIDTFESTKFGDITSMPIVRPVVNIEAGGDSLDNGVVIDTTQVKVTSQANMDITANRFLQANRLSGVSYTSDGGLSLISAGTPGSNSDVLVRADNTITVSAPSVLYTASSFVSVSSSSSAALFATRNVLLQTARNAVVESQKFVDVFGASWNFAANDLKLNTFGDQQYTTTTGAVSFASTGNTVVEADRGISLTVSQSSGAQRDLVLNTVQRDSPITLNARSETSNLVLSAPTASVSLTSSGALLSVVADRGVNADSSTATITAGAQDIIVDTSGDLIIEGWRGVSLSTEKPAPGADIIISSSSDLITDASGDLTITAGVTSSTNLGTNDIIISGDSHVIFATDEYAGGSVRMGSVLPADLPVEFALEIGGNSEITAARDWISTSASFLEYTTNSRHPEEGFGLRFTSRTKAVSFTAPFVHVQGVTGVNGASEIGAVTTATLEVLAQGTDGVLLQTTGAETPFKISSNTLYQTVTTGSVSYTADGTDTDEGYLMFLGNTANKLASAGSVSIAATQAQLRMKAADVLFSTIDGPARFTATGGQFGRGVTLNSATTTATAGADLIVTGQSVGIVSDDYVSGSVSLSSLGETTFTSEGDNGSGNGIQVISEGATASIFFSCGSEILAEAGGSLDLSANDGVVIAVENQFSMSSFVNLTFTAEGTDIRDTFDGQAAILIATLGTGTNVESIEVYSSDDVIIDAANNMVAEARSALTFTSGGLLSFTSTADFFVDAAGASSFSSESDFAIDSSHRTTVDSASTISLDAPTIDVLANSNREVEVGDVIIESTGASTTQLELRASVIELGEQGEPVVLAPSSRLQIPTRPPPNCGPAYNRAIWYTSVTGMTTSHYLCFCRLGTASCLLLSAQA